MDARLSMMPAHAYYLRRIITRVNCMNQSTFTPNAELRGLRVLVTGGTSGLGRALVDEFHHYGASVAFVARTQTAVARVAREVPGSLGIAADVADKQAIHRIVLQALAWRGGIDVLVNNASALGPVPLAPLADTDCEAFEAALAANVLGPFRLTKALQGALVSSARDGRGGVVVNVSSDAAVNAYPTWGAYGASKAALLHMTRIWNQECAALGVQLLSFDPGDMDTPLHALAVPDADPGTLRHPRTSARAMVDVVAEALRRSGSADSDVRGERAAASA
jgi:NAD(P)-dependent dehydrogenase (short-subunit alcohol dehydrogenase family)